MKNIIIVLIENLLLLPLILIENNLMLYLWLVPIPIIEICQLCFYKKDNVVSKNEILSKDILKAHAIEFLIFLFLFSIIYTIIEIFPKSKSILPFILILFLILNLNLFNQNIGFSLMKIKLSNVNFLSKLKILINNFIIISPLYIVILSNEYFFSEHITKPIGETLLFFQLINFFVRFFITKKKSLLELLLSIDYISLK